MQAKQEWRGLGWRHSVWDLHRFFLSLSKKGKKYQAEWLEELRDLHEVALTDGSAFPVDPKDVELFFKYYQEREVQFSEAEALLRTEQEALQYCASQGYVVKTTATKNQGHHQSSKSMIACVTGVASSVCSQYGVSLNADPQARSIWLHDSKLHVSARNLDGAIPSLANPSIVWEIKEYWGKTKGGSKMSDAVYECHLVGLELREFEERSGCKVEHLVFIDGKEQWSSRRSDLRRLIDLLNQGLIDHLIVGREVETDWEPLLRNMLGH